jgi:hypothetical protein
VIAVAFSVDVFGEEGAKNADKRFGANVWYLPPHRRTF